MSQPYVPGAPPTARDRVDAAKRALRHRKRAAQVALARSAAAKSDEELESLPIAPLFLKMLPFALRAQFRPDYAVDFDGNDIDAMLLLDVLRDGGRRSDQFEVVIENRRCRVHRRDGDGRRPDTTLAISLADLIRSAAAATDPNDLASTGRAAISGDTFLAVRFPAMFRQTTKAVISTRAQ